MDVDRALESTSHWQREHIWTQSGHHLQPRRIHVRMMDITLHCISARFALFNNCEALSMASWDPHVLVSRTACTAMYLSSRLRS
ncbi:hypothetical protein POPTR_013G159901v4 [Populus trichocarpa]|uniref:Uncharacterized protein n=1 Tax=Populus trichocarpa TaxID=3694 RepID=A0ACC0S3Z7_POPTR|nr:hypothetical protein BDE02_13G137600 [Populus trichocarpa]KAI9383927.1 hypothetical protein POPTR_013G159901v4 [Populus trichocarpa]